MGEHPIAHRQRQIANRHQVIVCFGGEADHVVQLQVLDAAGEDELGAVEDLVVGHGLVDDAAQSIRAGLRRDGDAALAALLQDRHDRRREIVQAQRRRADGVTHLVEPRENVIDVGMVAESDRHQPDAIGERSGRLGELQNARGREGTHRQIVVARPAEATEIGAAADHFDEQARAEFGVGREDAGRRRVERVGRLDGGFLDRQAAPPAAGGSCLTVGRRRCTAARRTRARRSRARRRADAAGPLALTPRGRLWRATGPALRLHRRQ